MPHRWHNFTQVDYFSVASRSLVSPLLYAFAPSCFKWTSALADVSVAFFVVILLLYKTLSADFPPCESIVPYIFPPSPLSLSGAALPCVNELKQHLPGEEVISIVLGVHLYCISWWRSADTQCMETLS